MAHLSPSLPPRAALRAREHAEIELLLSRLPIGWQPDLNDGVRMKIKWDKDRGKEPVRGKAEFPWFGDWDEATQNFPGVGKEPDGNRWNNCHYSIAVKQAATASQGARK